MYQNYSLQSTLFLKLKRQIHGSMKPKIENLHIILRDHMLCELKAAQSALLLIAITVDKVPSDKRMDLAIRAICLPSHWWFKSHFVARATFQNESQHKEGCNYGADLIDKMVLLIKEELHHFYQVMELIWEERRDFTNRDDRALSLRERIDQTSKRHTSLMLWSTNWIIGAFIEARSCERFAKLHLPEEDMEKFYVSLLFRSSSLPRLPRISRATQVKISRTYRLNFAQVEIRIWSPQTTAT